MFQNLRLETNGTPYVCVGASANNLFSISVAALFTSSTSCYEVDEEVDDVIKQQWQSKAATEMVGNGK